MTYIGAVSIGRISSSDERRDDLIYIELRDELSRDRVIRIEMTAEKFALAITGLSLQPCKFEANVENVGLIRENKSEWINVRLSHNREEQLQLIRDAAAAFEVDGWRLNDPTSVSQGDVRSGEGETILRRVRFTRYVKP